MALLQAKNPTPSRQSLTINYQLVSAVLLAVIVVMLVLWRPWQTTSAATRKITVNGSATLKASPDEYQFYPYYQRSTQDEATKLQTEITAKLKELGVKEGEITASINTYDSYPVRIDTTMLPTPETENQSTLQLTISLTDKDLAQKVQDYLLTTEAEGAITPSANFSTAKQKELKSTATVDALTDAKTQAEKQAAALGLKVGKVIEVKEQDDSLFMPYSGVKSVALDSVSASGSASSAGSLSIQAGEQTLTYTTEVIYELK